MDGNKEAEGLAHCDINDVQPSPDHTILAYAVDTTVRTRPLPSCVVLQGYKGRGPSRSPLVVWSGQGDEVYTIKFLDLATGKLLPDELTNHSCGFTWGKDSTELFYLTLDSAHRPYVPLCFPLDREARASPGPSGAQRQGVSPHNGHATSERHCTRGGAR